MTGVNGTGSHAVMPFETGRGHALAAQATRQVCSQVLSKDHGLPPSLYNGIIQSMN
jgi:hypothetical protein